MSKYRQNPALPWDARQTIFLQPSGKVLQAHEFARSGVPFPSFAPNSDRWVPALPGWSVWARSANLPVTWIDCARQSGMIRVISAEDELPAFAAAIHPAPPLPTFGAAADFAAYTIYSRVFQVAGLKASEIVDTFFGLMLSTGSLPLDGPFVTVGIQQSADVVPPPAVNPVPLTVARVVYVSPTGNNTNNGTSPATPWLTMARVATDLLNYSELRAPYTATLIGTGTIANANLWIPPIVAHTGGGFDVIGQSFTTIAGPFTTTAVTAAGGTTVTVGAGGLGINTRRGKTIRWLTGGQATVQGAKFSIRKTTDTVATIGFVQAPGVAIGDTFDIVEPAIALSGTAFWQQATQYRQFLADTGLWPYGTIVNIKQAPGAVLTLEGGTWYPFGFELDANTVVRLNGKDCAINPGGFTTAVLTRLGQLTTSSWQMWGLTQPIGTGSFSFIGNNNVMMRGVVVVPIIVTPGALTGGGNTTGSDAARSTGYLQLSGAAFGGVGASTITLFGPFAIGDMIIGGNFAGPLIIAYGYGSTSLVAIADQVFEPGAAVTSYVSTVSGGGDIRWRGVTAPALTAPGSIGTDARNGGRISWPGVPAFSGVAGDNIVDTAAGFVANAFFAAPQVGIFNPQTGGLIQRV